MKENNASPAAVEQHVEGNKEGGLEVNTRRSFIGTFGFGTAAAVALAAVPFEPLIEGKRGQADASVIPYNEDTRAAASYNYRVETAQQEDIDPGVLPDNGDAARYSDHSGVWSKALFHPHLGIPDPGAWQSLDAALTAGTFYALNQVQVGNPGGKNVNATFNGPDASFAFDLEGRDSHATNFIPDSPTDRSAQTAAEEVELYWAALLRDTQFTQYINDPTVAAAVQDLNNRQFLQGSNNKEYPYPLTANTLFRGSFTNDPTDPNLGGPYVSQFLIQPTMLGVVPITQMDQRFLSAANNEGGSDFMTTVAEYLNVENGFPPHGKLKFDPVYRYIRMGRDLAAYTHVDTIAQEYLIALLVLSTINAPVNQGNPYGYPDGISPTQHAFFTFVSAFEHCDAATTLVEVASRAAKAAWFHKWVVNLRFRPEEYAALVQAYLTNQNPMPLAAKELNKDLFQSSVLQRIVSKYTTYLMPQAFPEGAPTHPCYPTGHGTIAGACITVLKFFYDGTALIRPLLTGLTPARDVYMPSSDGLSLVAYPGNDANQLTINTELNKLGFNITFGHGIHAGIHFRSSSVQSMLLGEAVALTVLQDRANSYNEPFTVQLTKFDGTIATISNQS